MIFRTAVALLGLALSLVATAQQPLALATGTGSAETTLVEQLLALDNGSAQRWTVADDGSVVPIWSGADGQLLAVVAVPGQWGSPLLAGVASQPGAASWYLLGGTVLDQSGLRWQANNGFHIDALLGQNQSVLPALCGLACDSRQGGVSGSLGLGWMSPDGGLDLSYGLSWLQTRDTAQGFQGFQGIGAGVPVLTLPQVMSSGLRSQTALFARGRWRFDEDTALDIGASYGRGSTLPYGALGTLGATLPGIDIDQLSLSLGLDAGSLRGAIVGHVLRSDDPVLLGRKWTALDLGVSWRTPWRGEISVGAQNLWSAPLDAPRDTDPNQARTPYIQYRQDL